MAKRKKKTSSVKLNLAGVETRKLPKEGEYLVKVQEVTQEEGDKAPYLKWIFEVSGGKFEGAVLYNNTSLSEKSLWNVKALLEALGVEIPEDEFELDLPEMVDLELMVTVEHETYEGKKQARIVDFWAVDGDGKGGDEEDAPDFDEMDEKALKKFIKANDLDVDPDDYPKIKKLRAAVAEAHDAGGDDGDGDDDAPDFDEMDEGDLAKFIKKNKLDCDIDDLSVKKARKTVAEAYAEANDGEDDKKSKKKKKGKDAVSQDDIQAMDEDELEAFVEEHELDVKLSKYKTVKKKIAAVIDAGAEAGVVEGE